MPKIAGAPNMQQLNRFAVTVPGGKEAIKQPLYDYQTYAAAGQTQLNFFQTPLGSGGKTIEDTNMDLAGALPNGKIFLMHALEIAFFPGVATSTLSAPAVDDFTQDVYTFMKSGHLQFFYLSKPYLDEAPIGVIGQSFGIDMTAALSDSTTAGASGATHVTYAQLHKRVYNINPVRLDPQQNFKVTMDWPGGAVALPSTTAARVGVRLLGTLYRDAQ